MGIDSGKTSAVVCLTLDGRLILSTHRSSAGMPWIIESIREVGIPSIIASDKKNGTALAKKLNALFNSRLYLPERDISVEEKREIARRSGIKDPHERDACSAAIKAYNTYANKLNQAEHISRLRMVDDIDRIKAKIIDRQSISEAISGRGANR